MKEIKKYVAFNPCSSDPESWWTGDSLNEIKLQFWADDEMPKTIQKITDGQYSLGRLEIFDVKKYPESIDYLE